MSDDGERIGEREGVDPGEVLTYVKATMHKNGRVSFEFPDDPIVGRGLIDALRFEFDEKQRKMREMGESVKALVEGKVPRIVTPQAPMPRGFFRR